MKGKTEMNFEPCNMQQNIEDVNEKFKRDPYFYMPNDIWPEDATEIDNRPFYLSMRKSKMKTVKAVNESNYKMFKDCLEFYKEKHPEIEKPEDTDEFWKNCVCDNIISNAIENRDYIYSGDNDGKPLKSEKLLKQFDVVIPETIVGYLCHPYVVYDIKYQDIYQASYEFDDFAKEIVERDFSVLKAAEENSNISSEERKKIFVAYENTKMQFIKDGHVKFTVKYYGRDYFAKIRWFEYKDGKKILHKGVY